jgi:hypothetical protein
MRRARLTSGHLTGRAGGMAESIRPLKNAAELHGYVSFARYGLIIVQV